ncbi:MAG: RnfABCDGE type electron transport complex subunit B [Lachnospiraceae bacterium]|nr:RnfABCDGE type electron transport complex subunit B [Lachnospiraceae bacterium]MDD3614959.1 RnfABCDGE type electron transport complex subunit B [Lachnospiraceae bacterium]
MNIVGIVIAAVIVGGTGLFIGLFLGFFGKKFAVEVDEKEEAVRGQLPGNNCGGCGFPGCDGLAKAIAAGEAPVNGCPVGGADVAAEIAKIMGAEVAVSARQTAFVKCMGDCEKTKVNYEYDGVKDCSMLQFVPSGGPKKCNHGCLGFGSCVKACGFDAIHIVDGIAVVDKEACKACGKCVAACPQHLIELVPYEQNTFVACSSKEKGKTVMQACDVGCIGCKKCEKNCEAQAITVEDNIAHIDYSKCTNCGKCKENCPRKCII